ncbi:DedA family protein [Photobacterium profundum]|uniref:Hypothetical DedA family protein n=1 Tax=Photobacterium profundum (strain SS9) TaxID=298386 RepID=Q6LUR8_PHOPR|nr:DedA family protein [Photobacterium profundum]CAG18957.1 hypothetical DedA family protein [Photobacterium profundum SS9]
MTSFEHIIAELTPLLQQYGYWILAIAIAVEGIGIPAPGQSLLVVASLLAASGKMSLSSILLVAGLSGFIGNCCGFWIGRKFGHVLVNKQWIKPRTLGKLHAFIERYGTFGLLISRFIEGIKQFMALGCGIAQMPVKHFLIGNLLAISVWLMVFGVAPAYLHDEMEHILAFYHHYQALCWAVVSAVVVVLLALILRSLKKRRLGL